jgi:hypothetical protein
MTKLAAVIQVPFRSANQFLGEGGLQVRCPPSGGRGCFISCLREHALIGCLLWHPRQNPCHCRPTCQSWSYNRRFYSTAPPKTARRDKGPHQGPRVAAPEHHASELTLYRLQNVQNDTGRLATSVAKERELSSRLVAQLSTDISTFKNTPLQVTAKTDPCVHHDHPLGLYAHTSQIRFQRRCRPSTS